MEFHTHGLNGRLSFGEADDEGWMSCHVWMRAPGFEVNYTCNVHRQEIEILRNTLASLNCAGQDGAVGEWSTMELGISLRLEVNRLGQVKGCYELRSDSNGPSLRGTFDADQSHLRHWMSEVERSLSRSATK